MTCLILGRTMYVILDPGHDSDAYNLNSAIMPWMGWSQTITATGTGTPNPVVKPFGT